MMLWAGHTANAQSQMQTVGTWKIYPTYSTPAQKVIETKNKIYYTSGNCLFSYDEKTDENYAYSLDNKLNDTSVINIFYNYDRRYLLVAYQSGNIDLIYDDGTVKNLSDIKDSTIKPPITINSVCFDGDYIYVATSFGLVKFNEPRGEVTASGNFELNVSAVCVMGDRLVIHASNYFRFCNKNSKVINWEAFNAMYNHNAPIEIWGIDDENMMVHLPHNSINLAVHTINWSTKRMSKWNTFCADRKAYPSYVTRTSDGKFYYTVAGNLYRVTDDWKEELLAQIPDFLSTAKFGTESGKESLWALTAEGIGHYSFDGDGGCTTLMESFKPDALSVSNVRFFYPSHDGARLLMQNSGVTAYKFTGSTRGLDNVQTGASLDLASGKYTDITPTGIVGKSPDVVRSQTKYGNYAIAPTSLQEMVGDPTTHFIATADDGVYKVVNGKYVGRYDEENSPIKRFDNRSIVYGMSVDPSGNLWVFMFDHEWTKIPLVILPKKYAMMDPKDVTEDDWVVMDGLADADFWSGMDVTILHCKKSSMTFITKIGGEVLAIDHRGTPNNFADDRFHNWETFTDQDGKELTNGFKACMVEDLNGKVWIGTGEGVIEISNPANATNPRMTVTHVKVPRTDGSNLADYLLGTEQVVSISVDAANRKWLATAKSGLFLASPSGNEVLAHYNTDNSPLPTNNINCVYADKADGTIYVGTDVGLISYRSDATPACDDYESVLVYPNPIAPDYHGQINITGLMDHTLVKITDTTGNVIHQGVSEGGRYVWDGKDMSGNRPHTGVYYVMMSQNATGSASAAVAKIMFVR